ncbi:PP2C family serine/threonine-protein phosphatase [uncultured Pseudokineococcus sp.]|uniref:PP2C family protein-serine/threonine phosphatase n=1 Tax=uncultured Pseudokineococcus sp. TaxID=1642928 RepID=UPI002638FA3E|nr:PP2C family serine/threonine-protein phosphatase [uncultured Pseudokineococcus sp.]
MATALRYAARSDVGLVRSSNQDSAYVGPHLLVVADGMGGHAGGDVASSIAVAELSRLEGESHGADALGHLEEAVRRASARLSERVREEPALAGMGTTVTALLRSGDRLALAHIGDSRAYVLRDGELAQVTHDHTFVQHLVDEGRITAEEAEHHPQRSVLLRVLGDIDSSQELDTSVREARTGDRWLLCSDGLSGMVGHATLREALAGVPDVGECADLLVQLALRGGGSDNVTVVVADVVDVATAPPDHTAVVGAAAAEHTRPTGDATSPAARGAALGRPAPAGDDGPGGAAGATGAAAGGRRRGPWPRLLAGAVVLAVLVAGVLAAWRWSQDQYFVGADADGRVAVFRGLPQDVGPVRLSSVVEEAGLDLGDLRPVSRGAVSEGITVDDLAAARRVVATLLGQACPAPSPEPEPSPQPTPSPTTATTAGPTTSAPTAAPTTGATASPAPSATAADDDAGAEDVPAGCAALDGEG